MENYVEKALILDITNEKALALKKRLDKLIAALDKQDEESKLAAEKIRLENEENRPSLEGLLLLGCSIPVIIGLLLFILVSCVH